VQAKFKKLICIFGAWAALTGALAMAQQPQARHWAIVVHGGAGDIDRTELGPERDKAYREALSEAVKAGATVLDRGGSALNAVEAAIRVMEDDPHFNAARGAVLQ
jgi:beta-aspartyl-peptidase (threonine type)